MSETTSLENIKNTIDEVLNLNIPLISCERIKQPDAVIALYSDSPMAVVKEGNKTKLVSIKDIIETMNHLKGSDDPESLEFLEETTRVKMKNLKIIEKREELFEVPFLEYEEKKPVVKKRKIKIPHRIWIIKQVSKNKIETKVFAIKKWDDEKTILLKMPFPNIFHNNKICWGNASSDIPNNINKITGKYLDELFFKESTFTGDNSEIVYKDKKSQKSYNPILFWNTFKEIPDYDGLVYVGKLKEVLKNDF